MPLPPGTLPGIHAPLLGRSRRLQLGPLPGVPHDDTLDPHPPLVLPAPRHDVMTRGMVDDGAPLGIVSSVLSVVELGRQGLGGHLLFLDTRKLPADEALVLPLCLDRTPHAEDKTEIDSTEPAADLLHFVVNADVGQLAIVAFRRTCLICRCRRLFDSSEFRCRLECRCGWLGRSCCLGGVFCRLSLSLLLLGSELFREAFPCVSASVRSALAPRKKILFFKSPVSVRAECWPMEYHGVSDAILLGPQWLSRSSVVFVP
mmetsp:Transcript_32925/g.78460  ORF Transcript_32925/g.78460 Transcript_32925/m.78460 type:complete len:259 (-) Transcript_32925:23-799(-)